MLLNYGILDTNFSRLRLPLIYASYTNSLIVQCMTHKLGTQNRNSLSLSLGGPIFGLREFKIFGAPDLGEFRCVEFRRESRSILVAFFHTIF